MPAAIISFLKPGVSAQHPAGSNEALDRRYRDHQSAATSWGRSTCPGGLTTRCPGPAFPERRECRQTNGNQRLAAQVCLVKDFAQTLIIINLLSLEMLQEVMVALKLQATPPPSTGCSDGRRQPQGTMGNYQSINQSNRTWLWHYIAKDIKKRSVLLDLEQT